MKFSAVFKIEKRKSNIAAAKKRPAEREKEKKNKKSEKGKAGELKKKKKERKSDIKAAQINQRRGKTEKQKKVENILGRMDQNLA